MTKITKAPFGKLPDGREVVAYTLQDGDASLTVLNYGGILQSLILPNKDGVPTDILLGYDTVEGYLENPGYLGALIGRFGNRIDEGKLTIDGKTYELYQNDRGNHLHGGKDGFNAKIWDVEEKDGTLILHYFSKDGEENYPGNLDVTVVYSFENQTLGISYTAVSDKKTAINLTNHAYFNMHGEGVGDVLDQILYLDAPYMTPTDENLIPHGEVKKVSGTPFDFTKPVEIGVGDGMRDSDKDLSQGGGFDHCFVFEKGRDSLQPFGEVYSKKSGIVMTCYTDLPAVQLYAGCGLDQVGKGGKHYGRCGAFCLETQAIPNNVNVDKYASYGSSIFEAGQVYQTKTVYAFAVKK